MKQKIFTIQMLYRDGQQRLKEAGIREYQLDAWYLLEYITGISKASYYGEPDRKVDLEKSEAYFACIDRRSKRIPLQHITGTQMFMGHEFLVNEHVLIPRQDTEVLVEEALDKIEDGMRILDMCTGSGCILLSILKRRSIEGVGADISKEALKVAERNREHLELPAVSWILSDLFAEVSGSYDVILSNPPYIETKVIEELQEEVRLHDPYLALNGKEDGLYFYRRIVEEGKNHLTDGGRLIFEIGYDQAEAVTGILEQCGYKEIYVKKDLSGLDRVVGARYNKE